MSASFIHLPSSVPVSYTHLDVYKRQASCEAEQGEALALFVPYDTGFTAMVNGQAADIQRLDDTFMAVSLQEGENAIVLHYTPSGFSVGLILSVVGLLLLIGLCIWYLSLIHI